MMPVLALDFDGVLCDSAAETGTAGWKAGGAIWPDMVAERPPEEILAGFRMARPVIETGHESILLMRLLLDGEAPEILLERFGERAPGVVARSGLDTAALKALFGETRERWASAAGDAWVAESPLYPGVAGWLRGVPTSAALYIVTTKERRFVERLLTGHGIDFPSARIFGLDAGRPKEQILRELVEHHPGQTVCFVEDRLATLKRCRADAGLGQVALRLAEWGYNTEAERREALELSIPVMTRHDLLRIFDSGGSP